MRGAFSLARRLVITGALDYNHLENAFLIMSITMLMLGMVFSSRGLPTASPEHRLLSVVAATIIVLSASVLVVLLSLEVYRSVKLTSLDLYARKLEVERLEKELMASKKRTRRRSRLSLAMLSSSESTGGSEGGSSSGRVRRGSSLFTRGSAQTSLWGSTTHAQ
jgi:hypothetical protein